MIGARALWALSALSSTTSALRRLATRRPAKTMVTCGTTLGSTVLLSAALLSSACGTDVDGSWLEEEPVAAAAPTLTIVGPRDGLGYNAADDERLDLPGIQVQLRVDVDHDASGAVTQVLLRVPQLNVDHTDVVETDLDGRRAAFFPDVTVCRDADGAAPVELIAQAPGLQVRAALIPAGADG